MFNSCSVSSTCRGSASTVMPSSFQLTTLFKFTNDLSSPAHEPRVYLSATVSKTPQTHRVSTSKTPQTAKLLSVNKDQGYRACCAGNVELYSRSQHLAPSRAPYSARRSHLQYPGGLIPCGSSARKVPSISLTWRSALEVFMQSSVRTWQIPPWQAVTALDTTEFSASMGGIAADKPFGVVVRNKEMKTKTK